MSCQLSTNKKTGSDFQVRTGPTNKQTSDTNGVTVRGNNIERTQSRSNHDPIPSRAIFWRGTGGYGSTAVEQGFHYVEPYILRQYSCYAPIMCSVTIRYCSSVQTSLSPRSREAIVDSKWRVREDDELRGKCSRGCFPTPSPLYTLRS